MTIISTNKQSTAQITFTPKIGIQFTGISHFTSAHDKDISVFQPDLVMGGGVELGVVKKKFRYSLQGELNELGYGICVKNSFMENLKVAAFLNRL